MRDAYMDMVNNHKHFKMGNYFEEHPLIFNNWWAEEEREENEDNDDGEE